MSQLGRSAALVILALLASTLVLTDGTSSAGAAGRKPHAAHHVRLSVSAARLAPGDSEVMNASVPQGSWCALTARHRGHHGKALRSHQVHAKTRLIQFSWRTAMRAWPGTWRMTLRCSGSKSGPARRVATRSVQVLSAQKGGRASKRAGAKIARHIRSQVIHAATFGPGRGASGCDRVGTLEVRAGDWLQSRGGGVDVFSNGTSCTSLRNPYQCVELVNRLLVSKGWSGAIRGDATDFWDNASTADFARHPNGSGYLPVPGDIIVWGGTGDIGRYGHVQVVDTVSGTTVHAVQQNSSSGSKVDLQISAAGSIAGRRWSGNTEYVKGFLHAKKNLPSAAQSYNGHIVQWNGDRKTQKTAWWVSGGKRYWIPTSAIYYCLKNAGAPGPNVLSAGVLDSLPDQTGNWARCDSSGGGVGSGPPPAETSASGPVSSTPPPPTPRAYYETTGSSAHTWTNYTNAGGTQGPSLPANQSIQIACKLPGFKVSDGNTWWYRIAESPWNGAYYASADAFYNNGATSGSLRGTPFVDNGIPNC